jgi:hypothetical protein
MTPRTHARHDLRTNTAAQTDAGMNIVLCKGQQARAAGCERYVSHGPRLSDPKND